MNKKEGMIKMLDKKRILRTLVQSASGAAVALITAVSADFSKDAVITAGVSFISTVAIAVLMNINKQVTEAENNE